MLYFSWDQHLSGVLWRGAIPWCCLGYLPRTTFGAVCLHSAHLASLLVTGLVEADAVSLLMSPLDRAPLIGEEEWAGQDSRQRQTLVHPLPTLK